MQNCLLKSYVFITVVLAIDFVAMFLFGLFNRVYRAASLADSTIGFRKWLSELLVGIDDYKTADIRCDPTSLLLPHQSKAWLS